MRAPSALVVALLGGAMLSCREPPLKVAITVDDLPGAELAGSTASEVLATLTAAFARHKLPPVYGFVNGWKLDAMADGKTALRAWVQAGNRLGNHTFSHADLSAMTMEAYLADVERNEPLLGELGGGDWHVFRLPFLREGMDPPSRDRLRRELAQRGYRIAPVTLDFEDWAWNPAYARCLEKRDDAAIAQLKESWIASATEMLDWADGAAKKIYGRRIPQVLLMHAGAFDAQMIEPLLAAYEKRGVRFVSLDEALADPAVRQPSQAQSMRGNLLYQARETRPEVAPPPVPPQRRLDRACR